MGDELVDELEAPLVENRLDEDPDLLLVVLTAARHREDHDRECGRAPTGRIPQRFPPCFRPERKRADRVVRCQARGQRPCSNASARRRRSAWPSPARGRRGTLILVEGPAGVGKTELSREARQAAERARLIALEGKGSELEQPLRSASCGSCSKPAVHPVRRRAVHGCGRARRTPLRGRRAGFGRGRCRLRGAAQPLLAGREPRRPRTAAAARRRLPVGRPRVAALPVLPRAAHRGPAGRAAARRPPAGLGRAGIRRTLGAGRLPTLDRRAASRSR